jgi:tetratricopeptide (TPR) repeat protein
MGMPTRLTLLCLALALKLAAAEPSALLAEAQAAEARWDSRRALELFLQADAAQPNDPAILHKISKQYSDLAFGEKSSAAKRALATQALTYAQRAAALAPNDAVCALSLAICHGHFAVTGSVKEKIELSRAMQIEIQRALQLDPSYAWAHHLYGRWHLELADLGRTARFFVQLFYGGLPRASFDEGIQHLRRATELEPSEPGHWFELGFALARTGKRDEARGCWERGMALSGSGPHDARQRERARAALRET